MTEAVGTSGWAPPYYVGAKGTCNVQSSQLTTLLMLFLSSRRREDMNREGCPLSSHGMSWDPQHPRECLPGRLQSALFPDEVQLTGVH